MEWPYTHLTEYMAYYKVKAEERENEERERRAQSNIQSRRNAVRGR